MTERPVLGACPVDLHYPEPGEVSLNLASIVAHGRQIRRRRRLTRALGMVAACAAVVSLAAGLRGATLDWFSSRPASPSGPAARPIDAFVALHPPAYGQLTLLSHWPAGWTSVAWATGRGEVCWATYSLADAGDEGSNCWSPPDIPGQGTGGFSPLLPTVAPMAAGQVAEFGLVTSRASRVTVTFNGHPFRAGVVQVPMSGGKTIGVYMIWFSLPAGDTSYGSGNVGGAIAYDRAGRVIATHGPSL
jgi:hypothetical protein